MTLSILLALGFSIPLALPANAGPAATATATTSVAAIAPRSGAELGTDDKSSRGMARASAPAFSQAYARAYISHRYGWGAGQYSCLKVMWNRESNWRYWVSNPNGKYHGIPQTSSREWSKDGYTRAQYMSSPEVQIKVGARYIKQRYGSPCAAWAFWRNHHWY
ncbi:MAG: hypothetical protein ACOYEV_04910 [Candidatus Nanopelagicales bacterium]